MAILHADNFNYYGGLESYMTNGIYAEILGPSSLVADPDGISTTKVFKWNWNNSYMYRWVLPTAHATAGIAQRIWLNNVPVDANSAPNIMQWADGTNTLIAALRVTPTGAFEFYNNGVLIASSTGPVVSANGWYHVEAKLVCSTSGAATFEARVEGVTAITASSFSTTSATCAQVRGSSGHGTSGFTTMYIKDLVIWDGSGSNNTDFLGSVLVFEMFTTSDTAFPAGWTSTDANGFSVLDNNPADDTNHYISADDSPPAAAEFALTDLPSNITSVKALITRVRAAKSDGGDGKFKVSLHSGASDDDGADRPITTTPTYWSDVSEIDPNTTTAWTPTSANAATLKLTRTL